MTIHSKFPNLETEKFILRNVGNEDIEFVYRLYSNEKVCEFLYDEEWFTTRNEAKEFVEWNSYPETGLEAIMERIDHSDDETTKNIYLHVTKPIKKKASHKFSELMRSLQ